jgi:hypothetical protein
MNRLCFISVILVLALSMLLTAAISLHAQMTRPEWMDSSINKLEQELLSKYGKESGSRLQRGMKQVASFWRSEDGNADIFEAFVRRNFAGDQATLDEMFIRFERLLEQLNGHMLEIILEFRRQSDLDLGPIFPFDEVFAGYDPSAHVNDDFFDNKLAFTVLLNFPLTTLEQRLTDGERWSRRQWAEARLAQGFSKRIPAEVNLAIAQASAASDKYISEYNIWMHHILDNDGKRPFPPGLRLLSHWNLRDEIKALYSDPKDGPTKQKMIQRVMERIVTQTIPEVVVNNPHVDWNPYTNEVWPSAVSDSDEPAPRDLEITDKPEPDTRYLTLLNTFLAAKKVDPYSPTAPTLITRRFDENREIPESRVSEMFEQVLSSPLVSRVAGLIESRLGRPLEPYDIWYNGFRPRGAYTETELDIIISKRYPSALSFEKDIPELLVKLGFDRDRADYIASNIVVDPARGSGHAAGAAMRSAKAHLRTRVGEKGMDYKGFNIAVHELGHNVEQVLSLNDIDHTLLQGVPNTAFTEAMAFVFQAQDLYLLGLETPDAKSSALKTINDFWMTYEIAAVALVDMGIWHWMYDHPDATPSELKEATVRISKDIWNRYCAPVFEKKDIVLLGIYSHIIHSFLYIPDYPLGHLIAFQIEQQMEKAGKVGPEFERMAALGNIAPDIWMNSATGSPVSAGALLEATERALKELEQYE